GKLTSNDLSAPEGRVHGLRVEDILVKPENNKVAFSAKEVRAESAAIDKNRLANVVINAPRGDYDNGRITVSTPQAAIGRVETTEGRANEVALRAAKVETSDGRYKVTGDLAVKSAAFQGVDVAQIKGKLDADNKQVALNNFSAGLMGGTASGNLTAQLSRGGAIHVAVNFDKLATHDIYKVVASGDAPVTGTVSGNADLSFPSSNPKLPTGSLNAQLTAQTTQTGNAIPVNGTLALKAANGAYDISQLNLNTNVSHVTASGSLS